jgi:hypothetical protein
MDKHSYLPEDLNELERRLSAWQPNSAGMDADTVLFAAGRASVRPGPARIAWPALTTVLAALAIVLGLCLADERSERLTLAHRLRERPPAPTLNSWPRSAVNIVPAESPAHDEPPPDGYLASRRALERGLDAWPSRALARSGPTNPSLADPPVLSLGQREALLDP